MPDAFHLPKRMKQDIQVALDPPSLYLRAANALLRSAAYLFRAGVLSKRGLARAQGGARVLADLGLASWRRRRFTSDPPVKGPWTR